MSVEFSDQSLRKIAEQKILFRSTVKIHFFIFLMVVALLAFINVLATPRILWFLFPAFAWLIGIVLHFASYIMYSRGVSPKTKRIVIIVFLSYTFATILLWVINSVITFKIGAYENSISINSVSLMRMWAIYPTIFAGLGVLILVVIYLLFLRQKMTEEGTKSKKERAIAKEMQKIKNRQSS